MSITARLVSRVNWISTRERPFDYTDFEVENDCSHSAARSFLNDAAALGWVAIHPGKGGQKRREKTFFVPLIRTVSRGNESKPVALLREAVQMLYYAGTRGSHPFIDRAEKFLKSQD